MDFGFSSAARLKKGWQFDFVFRTGRRDSGALVRLLYVTNAEGPALAGVAVGKKIACGAQRVRGRRVLREAVRRLLPWTRDGVWIVASLRASGLEANARDVYSDLAACMKRRGLLAKDWPGADWSVDSRRG
ncbi:ribonuclease P protein component [Cloacibacillus sp. An23]|uniref:ribonuclease P protein component n=1 Tax=Cloacibacillus sp. An23 TaxID=1965591 RepID=UPI001EF50A79|nr:ribonuclease P protein component [Cloacibacillus sp. An23]